MRKLYLVIKYLFTDPRYIFLGLIAQNWFPISDRHFLEIWYRIKTGQKLDLDNPQSYNEKLQWLKLYDRQKIYTTLVDKYAVKQYVTDRIGEQYVIPLLGVWETPYQIDFDSLPNQFVLKVTHGGGNSGVVVCKDKASMDRNSAIKQLDRCMRTDGSKVNREWPYKYVERKVIAEEYMEDATYHELRDYKFFCFNGVPKIMFIASGRTSQPEPFFDFFDMDFNHLNLKSEHPVSSEDQLPSKPIAWEEMKMVAEKLSEGIPHVRIDLYEVNGRVYFGEYTLYHWAGCGKFEPQEWEKVLGEWIKLPQESK